MINQVRESPVPTWFSLLVCVLLLSACGIELGGAAEPGRQSADPLAPAAAAHTPTALPGETVSAADAEYALLANIYERASPSVVNIESGRIGDDGAISTQRGSGFVYDTLGHIVTNAHLVNDADWIRVTLQNTVVVDAQLLGADSFSDLAVLKVVADAERLTPAVDRRIGWPEGRAAVYRHQQSVWAEQFNDHRHHQRLGPDLALGRSAECRSDAGIRQSLHHSDRRRD